MVLKFDLSDKEIDEKIKETLLKRCPGVHQVNISKPVCPKRRETRYFVKRILICLSICLLGLLYIWQLSNKEEKTWAIIMGGWPIVAAVVVLLFTVVAAIRESSRFEKEKTKFEGQMRSYESALESAKQGLQGQRDKYIKMLENGRYFVEKKTVDSMHKNIDSEGVADEYFVNGSRVSKEVYGVAERGDILYKCGVKGFDANLFLLQKRHDPSKVFEIRYIY